MSIVWRWGMMDTCCGAELPKVLEQPKFRASKSHFQLSLCSKALYLFTIKWGMRDMSRAAAGRTRMAHHPNREVEPKGTRSKNIQIIGLFDLRKLLNLVIKLLFVLHGFSTMTSSIKILPFDLPGFNPGFKIVLRLLKLPPEVVLDVGFRISR